MEDKKEEKFFGLKFFKKLRNVDAFFHYGEKDLATLILKAANVIIDIWFWIGTLLVVGTAISIIWSIFDPVAVTREMLDGYISSASSVVIGFFVFLFISYGFTIIVKNQEDQIRERYKSKEE